jgi:multiple sugar transport system substrate-binding protein
MEKEMGYIDKSSNEKSAISKKLTRRQALSTAGKVAVGVVVAGVVAGVGGYLAGSAAAPATKIVTAERTIERMVTKTETVTVTGTAPLLTTVVTTPVAVRFEGVELTAATETGPPIAEPLYHWRDAWCKMTGAKAVNVVEIPYAELFEKIMLDLKVAHTYDILIIPADWAGDIMGGGYVLPLDDFIKKYGFPAWEDVVPTVRNKILSWGGKLYATPYDGDCHIFHWRKDALEVPEYQDKFKDQYGYRYNIPPRTWEEVLDIAKFFTGWDWNKDGKPDYGIGLVFRRGSQTPWFFIDVVAQYAVMPPEVPGKIDKYRGILYFDPETMEALCDTPGWVEGFRLFRELLKYAPPGAINWAIGDLRPTFLSDSPGVAMAVDWGDLGVLSASPEKSRVKDKVGFSKIPGASKYYDREKGSWVEKFNQIAILNFGGWIGVISKWSKNPEAAYHFLSFLASPEIDIHDVSEGKRDTGRNPYRFSHFENIDAWVELGGWSRKSAEEYLKVIKSIYDDPNALTDLRIPGQPEYWDALDIAISEVLTDIKTPEDAAKWTKQRWEEITDKRGRDQQKKLYREMLGLPP